MPYIVHLYIYKMNKNPKLKPVSMKLPVELVEKLKEKYPYSNNFTQLICTLLSEYVVEGK